VRSNSFAFVIGTPTFVLKPQQGDADDRVRMQSFAYSAVDATGLELSGELAAPDLTAAREALRSRGLLAVSITARAEAAGDAGELPRKVKPKHLQVFARQFATMVAAGVNVVTALVILEEQTDDQKFARVISRVRSDVEGGLLLSEALARHPTVFSRLFAAMVEAGEAAGALDSVLDRVAFQIEKETQIKRRVRGAMMYPLVVMTFAVLVLIAMLMFIVPIFVNIFAQLHGDLPTLTRLVVAASNLVRERFYIIFPLLGLAVFGFFRFKRTERGKRMWERLKLAAPAGIGKVVLKVSMARFSRTLSTLIGAGVDVLRALEITGSTAGNTLVEDATATVRDRVSQGTPIAVPLTESAIFPPMVSQMVRVGEETGELEKMLSKIADFYEDEVDSSIATLTSIIEPLMMIAVGVMVGIIVIAMYLPMFKLLSLVGNS
jgi:type IV pilus assembly protein PilC